MPEHKLSEAFQISLIFVSFGMTSSFFVAFDSNFEIKHCKKITWTDENHPIARLQERYSCILVLPVLRTRFNLSKKHSLRKPTPIMISTTSQPPPFYRLWPSVYRRGRIHRLWYRRCRRSCRPWGASQPKASHSYEMDDGTCTGFRAGIPWNSSFSYYSSLESFK